MSKRSAPEYSRPKRITLSVEFDAPKSTRGRQVIRVSDNDFIDELSDLESDGDDTCAVPDDQVPAVLRPEVRRKNPDFDEFGFNPVVRDAAQGAEVDAYMEANWTPAQFRRGIPELSRQGANNTAIVNWLCFEGRQKNRLIELYRKREFSGINAKEQSELSKLIAWFRARPCSLETASAALQRCVADE